MRTSILVGLCYIAEALNPEYMLERYKEDVEFLVFLLLGCIILDLIKRV